MLSLIKTEWLKIKKYPAFWWIFGIIILSYPAITAFGAFFYKSITHNKDMLSQIAKGLLGNPFAFPEAWHSIGFYTSIFVMIPAVLVIMLINNEYSYKTHRQNIIDGMQRYEFILCKLIDVLIVSVTATVVYLFTTLWFAYYMDSATFGQWKAQLQYIPLFLLQTFAQLSIAFVCGYFIRKAFLALGVFLFYFIVLENVLVWLFEEKLHISSQYTLPLEISDKLIPFPAFVSKLGNQLTEKYNAQIAAIPTHVFASLALTALIWLLCFWHYKKRDL